jgi:hypothetical protein
VEDFSALFLSAQVLGNGNGVFDYAKSIVSQYSGQKFERNCPQGTAALISQVQYQKWPKLPRVPLNDSDRVVCL